MAKGNLKKNISAMYNTMVVHWKTPPMGKSVAYKEILSYGFGGMGVQFVMSFTGTIALTATSFLVGSAIGIKPLHLQFMSIISTIIGFGLTILRSYIIDSVKLKMGKFRPWLATLGIPTVITSIVFVWLPYETMSYYGKIVAVLICYNVLQLFNPFYGQSFTDLVNVMSPNSYERTDIVAVSSIIYSLAPSIAGIFIPPLSQLTGGLSNITTYRIIHPIVAIVGVLLSYLAVVNTKERIITAKTHVSHFKFSDALRAVSKNKYFWITSLAGWLGFLEGATGAIVGWVFVYGYPEKMGVYGLVVAILGNAGLWAMMLCPFLIRTIGKRNLLIWANLFNIALIGLMIPAYKSIALLVVLTFFNNFLNYMGVVYNPGINADMRDYQQYYTGERIDGMFGTVGLVGSFVGIFTGLVLPYIYQQIGLGDNYNVLEVTSFRENMTYALIIAAMIGAFMNVLPYFFYDLTEAKQKGIVRVLKIRALFEDYGNGILKDEDLVEAIDIIDEANDFVKHRALIVTKDDIKKAKRLPGRTEQERGHRESEVARLTKLHKEYEARYKQECKSRMDEVKQMPQNTDAEKALRKAALKKARKENNRRKLSENIEACDFVIDEMTKYDSERMKLQVERSKRVVEEGVAGLYKIDKSVLENAKKLPKETHAQKVIRNDALAFARSSLTCKKALMKFFPDGTVVEPDEKELEIAEAMSEDTPKEKILRKKAIKNYVNKNSKFTRSVKILLDAERILKEEENHKHLNEIRAKYEIAKENTELMRIQKQEEIKKIEKARKDDMEKKKQERLEKKSKKGKDK